jgi:iron(III) transport system substrate-binding protein
MKKTILTRRQFTAGAAAGIAATALGSRTADAQAYGSNELIEAAKKEGQMVYYTADFTEPEQEIIKAFNKRFPFVRVEMVRAPGGQLITRIKTEAAANKLLADCVNHSDRGLMKGIADLFQDYKPPNADAYRDDVQVSPQLWPKTTLGWSIAYNTELEKNPPKSWMDLCKPQYGPKKIGQVIAPSGGTTWTRIMFERQTFGDDYWKKQAATQPVLYPSGAPTSDALVRGEISIGVLLYNIAYIKKRDGAPVDIIFGRRAAELLRGRRTEDGQKPERRQAVPELVHVR